MCGYLDEVSDAECNYYSICTFTWEQQQDNTIQSRFNYLNMVLELTTYI